MAQQLGRREFLQVAMAGGALCAGCSGSGARWMRLGPAEAEPTVAGLISPGCRGTKVKVARLYAGRPSAHWPTPSMDLGAEIRRYEAEFAARQASLADVEFVADALVTAPEDVQKLQEQLATADGVLLIHLSMGITPIVNAVLAAGKPTVLFAAPYSGHEWTGYGAIQKSPAGAKLECILSSDFDELVAGVRPFRAIHHLREAKIVNVTSRAVPDAYVKLMGNKFGTQVKVIGKEQVMAAYEAVPAAAAQAEAQSWIRRARAVVEPSEDEIIRSCRLALAFERILNEEKATVITTDCYGSMYHQLPAFPCIGNVRLNDMGLGGICESDLRSAMTHILLQSISGKPGFISDPTMDTSDESIILAHCLGSTRMDGPGGPRAPYKLRTIMERQEGAVPQVFMRVSQKVTQAQLVGSDELLYFTGVVTDAPDTDRGCRTKIRVKVDGSAELLWKNWSQGLHRVTCYGDLTTDLRRFCRFADIRMVDEAAARA